MKQVKLFSFIIILFLANALVAQDAVVNEVSKASNNASKKSASAKVDSLKNWETGGAINLNFAQVGLKNWAGGGQNSVALSSLVSLNANYEKDKTKWTNNLDVAYGIARVGGGDFPFKKSDDQLILISKYSHDINENWAYAGLLDFRTQMAPGYTYRFDTINGEQEEVKDRLISDFLSPGYAIVTAGIEYSRGESFYALISPIAGKITMVLNDELNSRGAFGVDSNEAIRFEFGALLRIGYKKKVMENVDFSTGLTLFQGYSNFGKIDVNWETLLTFKVNKYLSTTFSTLLIYDDDVDVVRDDETVGPAIQFKNVLNIGLLYKF